MPLEVTLAVLGAALAHAIWNAMIKSSRDVLLDMTLVVFFAGLVTAPFLLAVPLPPVAAWPYIAASMALHLVYYVALVGAFPDSHIVRKHGEAVAHSVMSAAQVWFAHPAPASDPAFSAWDESLKADGINPGTSADLTVATLWLAGVLPAWHGS